MPEPSLPLPSDDPADDLPRTVRRDRDAKAREKALREEAERAQERRAASRLNADEPPAATVTHIDMPFFRLTLFFLKAAIAAIPAMVVLGLILLLIGQVLSPVVQVQINIPPLPHGLR
jgi:hypothetical protein